MRKFAPLLFMLIASCTQKLLVFDGTDRTLHISNPVFTKSKEVAIDILGTEDCQPQCLPQNMMARPSMRQAGFVTIQGHNLYLRHSDSAWRLIDFFPYKNRKTGSVMRLTAVENRGDTLLTVELQYAQHNVLITDTVHYHFVRFDPLCTFKIWRKCIKKERSRSRFLIWPIATFFPLAHKML